MLVCSECWVYCFIPKNQAFDSKRAAFFCFSAQKLINNMFSYCYSVWERKENKSVPCIGVVFLVVWDDYCARAMQMIFQAEILSSFAPSMREQQYIRDDHLPTPFAGITTAHKINIKVVDCSFYGNLLVLVSCASLYLLHHKVNTIHKST